jgi:hypothetical protein
MSGFGGLALFLGDIFSRTAGRLPDNAPSPVPEVLFFSLELNSIEVGFAHRSRTSVIVSARKNFGGRRRKFF